MNTELRSYTVPISPQKLPELLGAPDSIQSEPLGITVDFSGLRTTFERLRSQKENPTAAERAGWDRELVEPLHSAIHDLPRRIAADMGVWHWLCIAELPDIVWLRWKGTVPQHPLSEILSPALQERFLGSRTLRGVSRNALARLWWCGESLYSDQDGYILAREALANQDFFQAIFERAFGLYPPAARACLKGLRDASEDERRDATRRLNHYLTTIAVETLAEEDIIKLVSR